MIACLFHLPSSFYFYSIWAPAYQMGLPTYRVGFSPSIIAHMSITSAKTLTDTLRRMLLDNSHPNQIDKDIHHTRHQPTEQNYPREPRQPAD